VKEEFSDYELYLIDQYLMHGRSLIVLLDGLEEIAPQGGQQMYGYQRPSYPPVKTGLEKLLAHYGVTVENKYIFDKNCYEQVSQSGKRPLHFAPMIKDEFINKEFDVLENIKGMIMLRVSPVTVDERSIEEKNITAHKLFSTSEEAWDMANNIMLGYSQPPAEDKLQQYPLAGILEGEFDSYFKDKGVPVKEAKEDDEKKDSAVKELNNKLNTENAMLKKSKPAKIFVIGTSELVKKNLIDADGNSPNALFVINIIDYMNNKTDWAVMRSKTQKYNPLKPYDPKDGPISRFFANRNYIKAINIAGLPLLVILAGFFMLRKRNSRKKEIYKQFYS
jgi:ABC-type uncharacterized transport system involved in gliding motility auxiliary subunit